MLPPPLESACSGVVSLRSVRLICFIAELNGLDLYQGDVSNAYLKSHCNVQFRWANQSSEPTACRKIILKEVSTKIAHTPKCEVSKKRNRQR